MDFQARGPLTIGDLRAALHNIPDGGTLEILWDQARIESEFDRQVLEVIDGEAFVTKIQRYRAVVWDAFDNYFKRSWLVSETKFAKPQEATREQKEWMREIRGLPIEARLPEEKWGQD